MRPLRGLILALALIGISSIARAQTNTPTITNTPTQTNTSTRTSTPTVTPYTVAVTITSTKIDGSGQRRVAGTFTFPTAGHGGYIIGGNPITAAALGLTTVETIVIEGCLSSTPPTPGAVVYPRSNVTTGKALAFWAKSATTVFTEVDATTDLSGYTCPFIAWGS